jgi:hypothetical protein
MGFGFGSKLTAARRVAILISRRRRLPLDGHGIAVSTVSKMRRAQIQNHG